MNKKELEKLCPATLAAQIHSGDSEAEGNLVSKYWSGLVLVMEMRTGDPEQARDLAQEACWRTILRLREHQLDEPAKLGQFLRTTAKNLHNNEWRKYKRRNTLADSDAIAEFADLSSEIIVDLLHEEATHAVRMMIERIEFKRYRELLKRHYVISESKTEICASMGIDSRAYDKAISRARIAFRKLVEKLGKSPSLTDLFPELE